LLVAFTLSIFTFSICTWDYKIYRIFALKQYALMKHIIVVVGLLGIYVIFSYVRSKLQKSCMIDGL
ncbi:hypothetical protein ACJX0J_011728, partial [Zea mays]